MDLKKISNVVSKYVGKQFLMLKNDNDTSFANWRKLARAIGDVRWGAANYLLADKNSIPYLINFSLSGILGAHIRNSIKTILNVSEGKAIELMQLIEKPLPESPKELIDNYPKYQLDFAVKIIAILEYASWNDHTNVIIDAYLMKMEQSFLDDFLLNLKKTYFQEVSILYITQQPIHESLKKEGLILNLTDFLPKEG